MKLVRTIKHSLKQFHRDESAVAAIEFAFILPVMLTLYIGAAEGSRLFIMDRKVAQVAASIGDLAARAEKTLNMSTLNDYFAAAAFTMRPYSADDLRQVVSGILVRSDRTGYVVWSRGFNGARSRAPNSTVILPDAFGDIYTGAFLIAGEAELQWSPIVNLVFKEGMTLSKTYYYTPRFSGNISIR